MPARQPESTTSMAPDRGGEPDVAATPTILMMSARQPGEGDVDAAGHTKRTRRCIQANDPEAVPGVAGEHRQRTPRREVNGASHPRRRSRRCPGRQRARQCSTPTERASYTGRYGRADGGGRPLEAAGRHVLDVRRRAR